MLIATRTNLWSFDHNISIDGRPLCRWTWQTRAGVGSFDLAGRHWSVRSAERSSPFHLVDDQGWIQAILEEDGPGYLLHADRRTHRFEHRSRLIRRECVLLGGEGRVSRAMKLTEADLPMFGLPVQILVLGVLLARWDAESQAG